MKLLNLNKFSKLIFIAVFLFSLSFLTSCSNEQKNERPESNLTSEIATISFPNARLSATFDNKVEFFFDEESETVVKIIASDDLLRLYDMTNQEFEDYVFYEMETLTDKDPKKEHDHATCMDKCWDKFTSEDGTKLPGRGGCRFGCWVSTAVQIIEAIADAIPL